MPYTIRSRGKSAGSYQLMPRFSEDYSRKRFFRHFVLLFPELLMLELHKRQLKPLSYIMCARVCIWLYYSSCTVLPAAPNYAPPSAAGMRYLDHWNGAPRAWPSAGWRDKKSNWEWNLTGNGILNQCFAGLQPQSRPFRFGNRKGLTWPGPLRTGRIVQFGRARFLQVAALRAFTTKWTVKATLSLSWSSIIKGHT